MKIQTMIEPIPKEKQTMGAKFTVQILIDDVEVWTRRTFTRKGATDALLYNLEKGIEIK